MHFCRKCIESGKLDKDERHRMQQNVIAKLNWDKPPKGRRAAHHRETGASEPVSHDRLTKEQRLDARRAERRLRHEARHIGHHHESAPRLQASQDPRAQQPMGAFPGNGFNVPAGQHEHAGHAQFQYVSAPPGYPPGYAPSPPGYAPSLPAHAMPYGAPSSGPGQHGQHIQHPGYGGGLAMPSGPMYGHHFSVNPGLPPRGDPRVHTPPGQPYSHGGYPVPNNFGGYYGGGPPEYTPAPLPPGFSGPGFYQPPSQPQPTYNDRGYVSGGNMTTGQPVSGPGYASGHAFGQPYGGGAFPHAQPPHERQLQPRGREGQPAPGGEAPNFAEPAREAQAREPTSQGHAEQPVGTLTVQQQQQQQAWEQEQARQAWQQEQARQTWERQQAQQAMQQMWERSQQQAIQQNTQPVAQQWQPQEGGQSRSQPAAEQTSQMPQQTQKQDEQRQERREENQSQQQGVRPISEGGAVSGAPPSTGAPFTLPPIVFAPHGTAPLITLPPITDLPNTSPPLTTAPVAVSGVQETRLPVLAPAPTPRPSAPELDTTSQSGQVQRRETCIAPTVVEHAQRPFGIPALARDLYAGRPNHYDETAARWAQSQPARPKQIREYDEDDYDDDEGDDDDAATEHHPDPNRACCPPSGQPPSRGRKRAHSQVSSIDSTLSAELELGEPEPDATGEVLQGLFSHEDIARERREGGERAALGMAAAANTLQGGGRGLVGATGALCTANDVVIRRRQEELDRERREEERGAAEPVEKKGREGSGGSGGEGGSGDAAPNGGFGRD